MLRKFLLVGLMAGVVGVSGVATAAPLWLTEDRGAVVVDSVLADDSYVFGGTVKVTSTVRGDLFVFGGEVVIESDIQNDLFVFGGEVAMEGTVGDDLRVFAGDVRVSGTVRDDMIVAGGKLVMADSARIGGDVHAWSGDLDMDGQIAGNLQVSFGQGVFDAEVSGDAELNYAEGLRVGEEAAIGGELVYRATAVNAALEGVAKTATFEQHRSQWSGGQLLGFLTVAGLLTLLWKWLLILFIGAILIWVLPKYFPKLVDTAKARKSVWSSILAGLIILIGVPVGNFLLMMTVIGIPLAIIFGLAYVILLMFGAVVGAYGIGSALRGHQHKNEWEQLGNLALGAVLLLVLGALPFVGWVLSLGAVLFGVGAIWFEKVRLVREYRDV